MTPAIIASVCQKIGLPEPHLKYPIHPITGYKLPVAWPEYRIALLTGPADVQDWLAGEAILQDWTLIKSTEDSLVSGGADQGHHSGLLQEGI